MTTPTQTQALTFETLKAAVEGSAAAFRCRRRLQPAGGPGDKVFPPTFAGAVYAVEQRRIPGRDQPVMCVLLDSVQSQANRMELALQDAVDAGRLKMPLLVVDFSAHHDPTLDPEAAAKAGKLIDAVGRISSLQVPHRLADAILRDSELDGQPFRKSAKGKALNTVSWANATPLFELCPTALVFGMWDSTGPKGGLGPKFERAIVSEVVGVGASFGVKIASRIDPLITKTEGIVLYEGLDGTWTMNQAEAKKDRKTHQPILFGKKGKVSEANLGNVTPAFVKYSKGAEGLDPLKTEPFSVDYRIVVGHEALEIRNRATTAERNAREGQIAAGGVTIEYAEQFTTLSLIVLRRLRFPVNGTAKPETNIAARTVLAALGLCAATLAFEAGMGLRSRCLLWPQGPMMWELLDKPGEEPKVFTLTGAQAIELFANAVEAAKQAGLTWEEQPLELIPQPKLVDLVRKSQELAVKAGPEEAES